MFSHTGGKVGQQPSCDWEKSAVAGTAFGDRLCTVGMISWFPRLWACSWTTVSFTAGRRQITVCILSAMHDFAVEDRIQLVANCLYGKVSLPRSCHFVIVSIWEANSVLDLCGSGWTRLLWMLMVIHLSQIVCNWQLHLICSHTDSLITVFMYKSCFDVAQPSFPSSKQPFQTQRDHNCIAHTCNTSGFPNHCLWLQCKESISSPSVLSYISKSCLCVRVMHVFHCSVSEATFLLHSELLDFSRLSDVKRNLHVLSDIKASLYSTDTCGPEMLLHSF